MAAIGGLVLAAGTDTRHIFPNDGAYTTASQIGITAMAISVGTLMYKVLRRMNRSSKGAEQ